jgi:hypothetical protein
LRDCYGVYECTSLRLTKVCHFQRRIELYPVCYTVRFISLTSNRDGLTLKFIFISSCAHCKANHKRLVACRLWPSRISELPVDLNHGLVGSMEHWSHLCICPPRRPRVAPTRPYIACPSSRRHLCFCRSLNFFQGSVSDDRVSGVKKLEPLETCLSTSW